MGKNPALCGRIDLFRIGVKHDFSYDREKDLLEIRGLMTNKEMNREQDNVLGYLSAKEVFKRINKDYKICLKLMSIRKKRTNLPFIWA